MKDITTIDKDYAQWISELKGRYRQSQIKAAVKVNSEMLQFYWSLGHDIVERKMENTYGSGFFSRLSADLRRELPDIKGFSPTNIKYFKYFYELYAPLMENRPQAADDLLCIPWDHHRRIIDKCKGNPHKALFFARQTRVNNWSRAVLLNFLDTDLYEREGKAITNFKTALPSPDSDLAQQMTKDPYCFDFLALSKECSEIQLKDAIMDNIQKFLLELGNGFAFVGREVCTDSCPKISNHHSLQCPSRRRTSMSEAKLAREATRPRDGRPLRAKVADAERWRDYGRHLRARPATEQNRHGDRKVNRFRECNCKGVVC